MRGVHLFVSAQVLMGVLVTDLQAQAVWQQSQSVQIQLGIRKKEGNLSAYEARVIVTTPSGEQVWAKLQGRGDDWSYVIFPDDFHTFSQQGDYSWVAVLNGTQIAGGRFVFGLGGARVASGPPQAGPPPSQDEAQLVAAMKADLRNLVTAEEAFFADSVKYTAKIGPGGLSFSVSEGNTLPRIVLTADGWRGVIGNASTRTVCSIFIGATPEPPAIKEGVPACR